MSLSYFLRRVGQMLLVVWIVCTIIFFLFRVVPGDQAAVLLGQGSSEAAREILRSELGIDQPLLNQYWIWLTNLLQGDLGVAFGYGGIPVNELLWDAVLRSFELATLAFLMAVALAIPVGVLAASREGSWIDHATRGISVVGFSMPSFWLGILLLLMFSATLPWFPSGGYVPISEDFVGHIRRLALPVVTVGVIQTGVLARFMRANMVEVRSEDYIRTARAKGLTERVVNFKHALRNSALSFLTVAGIQFGLLLGGMVVVETVFAWPGLGYLIVQALQNRSYAVVQGGVLVAASAFVVVNTAVDLAYAVLDPRIRHD